MPYDLSNYLVIGVSSRALFDLSRENEIFENEGLEAYCRYQLEHENDILEPGTGFASAGRILVTGDHNMFADSTIGLTGNLALATNMVVWACSARPLMGTPAQLSVASGGVQTLTLAAGSSFAASGANRRASSEARRVKKRITSKRPCARRVRRTPGGSGSSAGSNPSGARISPTRAPSWMPSFLASGVPE